MKTLKLFLAVGLLSSFAIAKSDVRKMQSGQQTQRACATSATKLDTASKAITARVDFPQRAPVEDLSKEREPVVGALKTVVVLACPVEGTNPLEHATSFW
jgi:hypothetical protein